MFEGLGVRGLGFRGLGSGSLGCGASGFGEEHVEAPISDDLLLPRVCVRRRRVQGASDQRILAYSLQKAHFQEHSRGGLLVEDSDTASSPKQNWEFPKIGDPTIVP